MTRRDFDEALHRLSQFTFELEDQGGYAGTSVDESARAVDLYWKGSLPLALSALLDDIQSACSVRVHPADHDIAELRRARAVITSAPDFPASGIVWLALGFDGSGLHLGYNSDEPPVAFVDRLDLRVPVRWEKGEQPVW